MAIEAVDSAARGLRSRRQAPAIGAGALIRRLDWLLFAALAALAAYGLWAINGITMHDPGGSVVQRQGIYVLGGVAAASSARSSSTLRSIGASTARSTSARWA